MATPLIDYLVDVDLDPKKALAFRKNPKAVMAAAGLSDDHQAALQSRDASAIGGAIYAERPNEPAFCPPPKNRLFTTI
jgi:hypothetical protein